MSYFCFNPNANIAMYDVINSKPMEDQTLIAPGTSHPDVLRAFGSVASYPPGAKWQVANAHKSFQVDIIEKLVPRGTTLMWDIIGDREWHVWEGLLSPFDIGQEMTDLSNEFLREAYIDADRIMAEVQAKEED
jgi:hypothetical protein